MHRQGQKYRQKHERKRLVEFHNHLHVVTFIKRERTGSHVEELTTGRGQIP